MVETVYLHLERGGGGRRFPWGGKRGKNVGRRGSKHEPPLSRSYSGHQGGNVSFLNGNFYLFLFTYCSILTLLLLLRVRKKNLPFQERYFVLEKSGTTEHCHIFDASEEIVLIPLKNMLIFPIFFFSQKIHCTAKFFGHNFWVLSGVLYVCLEKEKDVFFLSLFFFQQLVIPWNLCVFRERNIDLCWPPPPGEGRRWGGGGG